MYSRLQKEENSRPERERRSERDKERERKREREKHPLSAHRHIIPSVVSGCNTSNSHSKQLMNIINAYASQTKQPVIFLSTKLSLS